MKITFRPASVFAPSWFALEEEKGVPARDHYLYQAVAPFDACLCYYRTAIGIVGIVAILVFLAALMFSNLPWAIRGVLVGLPFSLAYFFATRKQDPAIGIRQLAECLKLTPMEMCTYYLENGLKLRARSVLYDLADQHSECQRKHAAGSPEHERTRKAYAVAHARLKKYGLIPPDICWKPYFNKKAPVYF